MNIGLVIYGSLSTLSGGYLYDRKLTEHLRGHGDTVEIISLPWRNYALHLTDNLCFRLPPDLDILIQDELNHPSLIAANAGKHDYPVVSLVHHLRSSEFRPAWQNFFYRVVEKKYLQSIDGFIFNSQTTKSAVNGFMVNEKKSIVAYPPTNRFGEAITANEIIKRTKNSPFRILFLGNVIERKGLHTLLNALSILHSFGFAQDKPSSFILDIVGSLKSDPEYSKRIQKLIESNGLSSFVFLHDSLNDQPLIELFKQSHVLVVPSSYEGFGIVYLEGMGFGLPAIGTTAGAASEIITHGQNGFLIRPDDAEALAEYLSGLAADRNLLAKLSVNALNRFQQQPKWEQTAGRIRSFLLSMI